MCLEGVQLYVMLVEVFEAEKSRVLRYYVAAYGTEPRHFNYCRPISSGTKCFIYLFIYLFIMWFVTRIISELKNRKCRHVTCH